MLTFQSQMKLHWIKHYLFIASFELINKNDFVWMCSVLFKILKAFFFKSRYRSSLKSAVTDANGRYVYYLGPALFRDLLVELRKMAAKLRPENCRR